MLLLLLLLGSAVDAAKVVTYNPPENMRTYSSLAGNSTPGVGDGRSMLDGPNAWSASSKKTGEWLQMDLAQSRVVYGIITQRRKSSDQRVDKYTVSYAGADKIFKEVGVTFTGNVKNDANHVIADLPTPIYARYVRLTVTSFQEWPAMRAAVRVAERKTYNPPENARTYSTVFKNEAPGHGHARSTLDGPQAWSAEGGMTGDWINMDLGHPQRIAGIITQRRKNSGQRISKYTISYSDDNSSFKEVGITFIGNSVDDDTKVERYFPDPIFARYVRITVVDYISFPSMRCGVVIENTSETLNPPESSRSYSSIHYNNAIGTGYARSMLDSALGWNAGPKKNGEWIKVDIGSVRTVTGVVLQRLRGHGKLVKKYSVEYSVDNSSWTTIDQIFAGVLKNDNSRYTSYLPTPVEARYIKMIVREFVITPAARIGIQVDFNAGCNADEYGDIGNCKKRDVCNGNATDANAGDKKKNADCSCNEGFFGTGLDCSVRNKCHANATDANAGDYTKNASCSCNEGFFGSGLDCSARNTCHANATDTNPGDNTKNASCSCNEGHFGNGLNCTFRLVCHENGTDANAGNLDVQASCSCNDGHYGDGVTCSVRDVCSENGVDLNTGNNAKNADCECNDGFGGNGIICTVPPTLAPSISPDFIDEVSFRDHYEKIESLKVPTRFIIEMFQVSNLYAVTPQDSVDVTISGSGTLDDNERDHDYVRVELVFVNGGTTLELGTVKGDAFDSFNHVFDKEETVYLKFYTLITGEDEDYAADIVMHSGGEVCMDTAGWATPSGNNCFDFTYLGICSGGKVSDDDKFKGITSNLSAWNEPQQNCCKCGGGMRSEELCDYTDLLEDTNPFLATKTEAWFACQTLFGNPANAKSRYVCDCLSAFSDDLVAKYDGCMIRNIYGVTFGQTLVEARSACLADSDVSDTPRMDYRTYRQFCEFKGAKKADDADLKKMKADCSDCGGKWKTTGKQGCKVSKKTKVKCKKMSKDVCELVGECTLDDADNCGGDTGF